MTNFDYAFTLIGLILGLSIAEILTGLIRTVKVHRLGKSGWLTPFLGLIVICDLTTFWGLIGDFRDRMPTLFQALGAGVVMTSLYYAAASFVFPNQPRADLDDHFFQNKRLVLGLVIVCNLILWAGLVSGWSGSRAYLMNGLWLMLMSALMLTSSKRVSYLMLSALLAFYIFAFVSAGD